MRLPSGNGPKPELNAEGNIRFGKGKTMKFYKWTSGKIAARVTTKYLVGADEIKMAILEQIEGNREDEKITRASTVKLIKLNLFLKGSTWAEYGSEQLSHNFKTHPETQEYFAKLFPELTEKPKETVTA